MLWTTRADSQLGIAAVSAGFDDDRSDKQGDWRERILLRSGRGLVDKRESLLCAPSLWWPNIQLTTDGDSRVTTLTSPDPRGTAFLAVNGVTNLWVGNRTGGDQGTITEIDTVGETVIGDLLLNIPPTSTNTEIFGGVMGLAQHPDTGVIYAMRAPLSGAGDATGRVRELITINMATGDTTLVGVTPVEINSIVFYTTTTTTSPAQIKSVARSGNDITLAWTGGVPPYNIDGRASLSAGLWSTVVSNILTLSATVTNGVSGPAGFFRVSGH